MKATNAKLREFEQRYEQALRAHLKVGAGDVNPALAQTLAQQALDAGVSAKDFIDFHENLLVVQVLPSWPSKKRGTANRRASAFFAATILPTVGAVGPSTPRVRRSFQTLSERGLRLALINQTLRQKIAADVVTTAKLKVSKSTAAAALRESNFLKEKMRRLTRRLFTAHEDERKRVSRDLHDVIAQALTGINILLATLQKQATLHSQDLARNISSAQLMVEKSAELVTQFARELRPPVLDDLGLIPALHASLKTFTTRTGIRTHLKADPSIENLETSLRTVLFRVAQEGLTNVSRHAQATQVESSIRRINGSIVMKIKDDGRSFNVQRALAVNDSKHLGLLGMRERLEMVGGTFEVESTSGKGTTITATIPLKTAVKHINGA